MPSKIVYNTSRVALFNPSLFKGLLHHNPTKVLSVAWYSAMCSSTNKWAKFLINEFENGMHAAKNNLSENLPPFQDQIYLLILTTIFS